VENSPSFNIDPGAGPYPCLLPGHSSIIRTTKYTPIAWNGMLHECTYLFYR